jgi:pimeloyl-ACP methyl ester carboxylesterase
MTVDFDADGVTLEGTLETPDRARGLVLFAHGSGSSRHSPRNQFVAAELRKVGLGTLLFDLLTEAEDVLYQTRFDVALLARRLAVATGWAAARPDIGRLHMGYFGASTGAAAALVASTLVGPAVRTIVSRGGRPDLAGFDVLSRVGVPTLLIVGGADHAVLDLNRRAAREMGAHAVLTIVPGATHLFEEPGALAEVARLSGDWFLTHL